MSSVQNLDGYCSICRGDLNYFGDDCPANGEICAGCAIRESTNINDSSCQLEGTNKESKALIVQSRDVCAAETDCIFFKSNCCFDCCTGKVFPHDQNKHQERAVSFIVTSLQNVRAENSQLRNQLQTLKEEADNDVEVVSEENDKSTNADKEPLSPLTGQTFITDFGHFMVHKDLSDLSVYCGSCDEHSRKQGIGQLNYKDGKYVGEWHNDQIHDKGEKQFSDGSSYSGEFKNGLKHGHGVLKSAAGDVYQGSFAHDQFSGQGTFTWADGGVCSGQWREGKLVEDVEAAGVRTRRSKRVKLEQQHDTKTV